MHQLKHPYTSIQGESGLSYGGNQGWSHRKTMRQCGCGVIAATDLLIYLRQSRPGLCPKLLCTIPQSGPMSYGAYIGLTEKLRKKYFPLIPGHGIAGVCLSMGLNRCFRDNHIPLRATWGVWGTRLWEQMKTMLDMDLPVIFAIGTNLPFFWTKHRVRLYVKGEDGVYRSVSSVKAHYMMVTGMDEKWLRLSSWGREYYISRREFTAYVSKHSSYLVSNLIMLKPIRGSVPNLNSEQGEKE